MTAKLSRVLAACILAILSAAALAQYPSRPIKLIVPIPAGGAPDIAARVVGQKLSELLGQAFVIENHAGSNGNIAGDLVAKAPPDGYTLLLGQDSLDRDQSAPLRQDAVRPAEGPRCRSRPSCRISSSSPSIRRCR